MLDAYPIGYNNGMRVLLIGGHISPLLATIEALQKEVADIVVVTRRYSTEGSSVKSQESQTLQAKGISHVFFATGRLQRHFGRYTIISLAKIPVGFIWAIWLVKQLHPAVTVSFGGYLSVPIVVASWLWGIPVLTHEESTEAGLANKVNSWFAKKVAISWESSRRFFPKHKTVVTGNPIRAAVFVESTNDSVLWRFLANDQKAPLIYVTGGNQGSHAINTVLFQSLELLIGHYRILHQTGNTVVNDVYQSEERMARLPDSLAYRYMARPFVGDDAIGAVLAHTSLVVGRSGVNTVSEMAALGIPAIFVPLPFAQRNEQAKNAKLLASIGAAVIIDQPRLDADLLIRTVNEVFSHYREYKDNAQKAKALVYIDAGKTLADQIRSLV